jgi:non-heme chloroperoxidase
MTFIRALVLSCLCGAAASAATQGTVQSGDASIHYGDSNLVHGVYTLVLIPGWSTDADVWQEQVAHFAPEMRVVVIDPRSQGASGKTVDGNTPEQRAQDYERAFDALGLRNIVLVGWSQGVQDVAAYADAFGTTRIGAFVLVDAAVSEGAAAVHDDPKGTERLLSNLDLYARAKHDYLQGMMRAIFIQKMPYERFNAFVATGMGTPTNTGIAMLAADLLGKDRRLALKKMDKPTLVIASATSPELAAQRGELKALPHGTFASVDKAGHGVFVDQPEAFDHILETFLASLPH